MTYSIIGSGLIGTSIGLALRRADRRARIIGWDPVRANATAARRRRAFTELAKTREAAIENADVVVLAAPLDAVLELLPEALTLAKPSALVMDVAGVKRQVAAKAGRLLKGRRQRAMFVAGHPLAGRESLGPQNADATIFSGRPFALYAPPQRNRQTALRKAKAVARALRAIPVVVSPDEHDRLVAATSALPQLSATALALTVGTKAGRAAAKLAGPGLEGAIRLAVTPYSLWRAPLDANAKAVRSALDGYIKILHRLLKRLEARDQGALARSFARAATARRRVQPPRRRTSGRH